MIARRLQESLGTLWRALRRCSGDDAYERYLAHCHLAHPGGAPLSAKEFYRRELERKWSGINRCC
jgi:uncharacterized short protein YbdD (DUF466 family)